MKTIIILAVFGALSVSALSRSKREAYALPDGAELLLGPLRTTFQCQQDGYYADVDNECKIFHVCHTVELEQGPEIQHYSFLCGNTTVFSQLTLSCNHEDDAIPCGSSPDFFYLNSNIGREDVPFLQDDDVLRGESLRIRPAHRGAPAVRAPAPIPARRGPGNRRQ